MAETGKKIEVRYGAFACRVEGFDDPVGRLREVLSLMQRVIAETPALAEHAPELDDAQLGRIRDALGDGTAEADAVTPGLLVIRSDEDPVEETSAAPSDAADAETEGGADAAPVDAGPHPSAALHAAPAAALAEAAFAAGIASEDASDAQDENWQAPLGAEDPEQPASPAALFAAPAAGLAETAFASGPATAAPADPDDDAEDPNRGSPDEAPDERIQPGGVEHALAGLGGPGDGWAPWGSGPAAASIPFQHPSPSETGRPGPAAEETGDAPAVRQSREPAPEFGATEREEPMPVVNIFAPPPADGPASDPTAERGPATDVLAAPPGEPPPSLRRKPGPAAAYPHVAPQAGTGGAADRPGGERVLHAEDADVEDPDEVLDDGAGDWREPDAEPEASTENRLAALITRYQSSLLGRSQPEPAPEAAVPGTLSAAELAERSQATEVHDLLAASAAWLTLAGHRARFTRREVMEVFETLPGSHPRTLEARIKGFGKLVRSGTLQLVDEGAFTLAPRERARFAELFRQG